MPSFLYDVPNWQLGTLVVLTVLTGSLAAYGLFRWSWRVEVTDDNKGLALGVLGVVATINSLLLAFSAVSVWESFGEAEHAVMEEANTASELARDLAVYDSPESQRARTALRAYAQVVVDKEWEAMRNGNESREVWAAFDEVFRTIGALEPDTPRRAVLLPEIWGRTNELLKHRRERLHTSQSEVPGTLWTVVVFGTIITMLTTFVLPPAPFNVLMIGALALSLGLVFFFIIAMDRPFAGKESINPAPFQSTLDNMRRWDSTYVAR